MTSFLHYANSKLLGKCFLVFCNIVLGFLLLKSKHICFKYLVFCSHCLHIWEFTENSIKDTATHESRHHLRKWPIILTFPIAANLTCGRICGSVCRKGPRDELPFLDLCICLGGSHRFHFLNANKPRAIQKIIELDFCFNTMPDIQCALHFNEFIHSIPA